MKLLDLFCGAGGCSVGYSRAGFEVVGVDHAPQKRYPFEFEQRDALEALACLVAGGPVCGLRLRDIDAIHASPPCQGYSRLRHLPWLKEKAKTWPKLIDPCRDLLGATGKPWVVENVEDAPLGGVCLCGRMFGLPVYRHRKFESSVFLMQPSHPKHTRVIGSGRMFTDRRKGKNRGSLNAGSRAGAWGLSEIVTVAGGQFKKEQGERALGINWMNKAELAQAVPPAFTEFIGLQLADHIRARATA